MSYGILIDYQAGAAYEGGLHVIGAAEIPIVVIMKSGTILPNIERAQSARSVD